MTQAPHPARLLVLEDDDDIGEQMVDALAAGGLLADRLSNGLDGLEAVKTGRYCAVMTDLRMPKMTGIELLAELRVLGLDLPVVILTGFGDLGAAQAAMRLGAIDFIEKPCDSATILAAAERARDIGLRRARLRALLAQAQDGSGQAVAPQVEAEERAIAQLQLAGHQRQKQ